jgi:HK97 family phage portal protein
MTLRLFGFEFTRMKSTEAVAKVPASWDYSRGWFSITQEPFTGAWQRNMEIRRDTILAHHAIYRCITLISQDIAKMRLRLVQQSSDGIWLETFSPAFSPVLAEPNSYQTTQQFIEDWMRSKLIHGNTFVLKTRDERNVVTRLYILDPRRTKVLVADDGSVFYELAQDNLTRVSEDNIRVPASEIIHDRYLPLYHPLCGISPITACALAGLLGLNIQANSEKFFANRSIPGGILTAPHVINDEMAKRLKEHWENHYSGVDIGRGIAVLGDGLKFEAMKETATDAQLAEQLKLSAEIVCSAFGVPPYKIGMAPPPAYNNVESLNTEYYSACIQTLMQAIEGLLDKGLGLIQVPGKVYGTDFDENDLLRMDTQTKAKSWTDLVKGRIASSNEGRAVFNLSPVVGGDTPMGQDQDHSLEWIARRDAMEIMPSNSSASAVDEPDDKKDGDEDGDAESRAYTNVLFNAAREYS